MSSTSNQSLRYFYEPKQDSEMISEAVESFLPDGKSGQVTFSMLFDPVFGVKNQVLELPQYVPLRYRPTEFFAAVQEWEGVVTGVNSGTFTADLYDVLDEDSERKEIAEISFHDINRDDYSRVREGAIFRWLIGHSRTRSGEFSRKWVIYFRRITNVKKKAGVFSKLSIPQHLVPDLERPVTTTD